MIVLQGARERVEVLRFSPDSRLLAAPCAAGVQVWNDLIAGGRPPLLVPSRVWAVDFTADGQNLVLGHSGDRGCGLLVHDLGTAEATEVPTELPGWRMYFALSPDGRFLVVAQVDYTNTSEAVASQLYCRPLADPATSLWTLPTRLIQQPPVVLPGGKQFLVVEEQRDSQRAVTLYVTRDARTGQAVTEVPASGMCFDKWVTSADHRLIACHRGIWVGIFRSDDMGAEPVLLRNDSGKQFTGLAFHPSGRYLAATSNDATVKLYDTSTWKVAHSFNWEIGRLRSVAFSSDGMLAAVGGDKGKIVVWDVDL
jgi:WD40 repeat protein